MKKLCLVNRIIEIKSLTISSVGENRKQLKSSDTLFDKSENLFDHFEKLFGTTY